MNTLEFRKYLFGGKPLAILLINGRPAWSAHKSVLLFGDIIAQKTIIGKISYELMNALEAEWIELDEVARRLDVPSKFVWELAKKIGLLEEKVNEVRPFPVRRERRWEVSFRFGPNAVAQIETWFNATDPPTGGAAALAA